MKMKYEHKCEYYQDKCAYCERSFCRVCEEFSEVHTCNEDGCSNYRIKCNQHETNPPTKDRKIN